MALKLYNPSSFAQQLTPEHKIWVQAVHKALSDLKEEVAALQAKVGITAQQQRGPNVPHK